MFSSVRDFASMRQRRGMSFHGPRGRHPSPHGGFQWRPALRTATCPPAEGSCACGTSWQGSSCSARSSQLQRMQVLLLCQHISAYSLCSTSRNHKYVTTQDKSLLRTAAVFVGTEFTQCAEDSIMAATSYYNLHNYSNLHLVDVMCGIRGTLRPKGK